MSSNSEEAENTSDLKKTLYECFDNGDNANEAHSYMKRHFICVSLKTCNEHYLRYCKPRNNIIRKERYFKTEHQMPAPPLRQSISEGFDIYMKRKMAHKRKWEAKKTKKRLELEKKSSDSDTEQEWDPNLELNTNYGLSDEMVNESISLTAREHAKNIVKYYSRNRGYTSSMNAQVLLRENIIEIKTTSMDVCKFETLPYGCEYSLTCSMDPSYHRCNAIELAVATLIELLSGIKFKSSLSFTFCLPTSIPQDLEEDKIQTYEFFKVFQLSRNLIDFSKIELKMIFESMDAYEALKSIMPFTPISFGSQDHTFIQLDICEDVKTAENRARKKKEEISQNTVKFEF